MGKLKELLEKQKSGTLTEDEQKELDTLLTKADEGGEPPVGDGDGSGDSEEEEAVDKLADMLVTKATKGIEDGLAKVLKGIEDKQEKVVVNKESKIIVDPKLGRKTVEELAELKMPLPGRKDKQVQEISMKTAHFVEAMLMGDVQKLQVLVEGTGSRGGFLVPDDFANMIVEDIRDVSIMRQLATVMTTTSDTLRLPALASRPRANWRSEAAVKSTSTVDFAENVFTPYSLATIVPLSNELVADASLGVNGNIVNYVAGIMVTSLNEREEQAFWVGDGSGKPTGVDNYTLRTVTATNTDAGRADAVIQAWVRTPQGYRNRGAFVANAQTIEKIMTLKDSQGNYLTNRLADSPVLQLKGRPLYEQNDIGGGKLFYGDFGYYTIVDREGISIRVSDEATVASQSAFERNLTFVRVEKRVDGELVLPAAVTEVQGLGTP